MVDYYTQNLNNRPSDAGVAEPMRQISRKLAWAGALLTIVLGYAWLQFATLEVRYQKEQIARENQRLEESLDQVKVEHSSLVTPDTVEKAARKNGFIRFDEGVQIVNGERPLFGPGEVLLAENRAFADEMSE